MINYVSMILTNQCNSVCQYCYVDAKTAAQELLPISEVQNFLQRFAEQNGRVVLFTGGEVLLYPGIEEVVQFAKGLNLHVRMFTNGLLLDQARVNQLKDFVDGFAISLDGPEEIHDARRGVKGAYQKALAAMELLKEVKKDFSIQMTISKSNMDYIDHVAGIARQFQVGAVKLADMMKVGRAMACPEEHLREDDLLWIKRKAAQLSEQYQYQTIFQTNLSTRSELDMYYGRGELQPVFWVDSLGNIFMYITQHEFFRVGHISSFPMNNEDALARKRQIVAERLFPTIRERRICDIYEEIEQLASHFAFAD